MNYKDEILNNFKNIENYLIKIFDRIKSINATDILLKIPKCKTVYDYFLKDQRDQLCDTNDPTKSRGQFYCDTENISIYLSDIKEHYKESNMANPTAEMQKSKTDLISDLTDILDEINICYKMFSDDEDYKSRCDRNHIEIEDIFTLLDKAEGEIDFLIDQTKRVYTVSRLNK